MGNKSTSNSKTTPYGLKSPHYFLDEVSEKLSPPIDNFEKREFKSQIPKDVLIFKAVKSIPFLVTASLVCQEWYQASLDDAVWNDFVIQRNLSIISSRQQLFDEYCQRSRIMLPVSYKGKNYSVHSFIKVTVIGGYRVGKSATTCRFVLSRFVEKYDPTIEDSFRIEKTLHDTPVMYEVVDSAGNAQFLATKELTMKNSHALIVLYSIVDRETLAGACDIIEHFQKVQSSKHPLILVGHKLDLHDKRVISYQEGLDIAKKYDVAFIEASAKSDINIETIFMCVAEMCMIQSDVVFPPIKPARKRD